MREPPRSWRAWPTAWPVFVLSLALYAVFLQDVTYGDGVRQLLQARYGSLYAQHLLYVPSMVAFSRPLEVLGIEDRAACFLFSAFATAIGNAFLFLLLIRVGLATRSALALVALAATTPVLLFFGTTVENHGQHYAWTCIALVVLHRAMTRDGWGSWLFAGVLLACIPASHASGWMLLPALVLLAWTVSGTRPLLADFGWRRVRNALLLAGPALFLFILGTDQIRVWMTDDWGFDTTRQVASYVFTRPWHVETWPSYLLEDWLLPAFGCWLLVVFCWPALRRSSGLRAAVVPLALLPYWVLLAIFDVRERGAYFIALVPMACLFLAWQRRGSALPRRIAVAVALLVPAQLLVGLREIHAYPASVVDAPWTRAADAVSVAEALEGRDERTTFLVKWGMRVFHLIYDHRRTEVVHGQSLLDIYARPSVETGDEKKKRAFIDTAVLRIRELQHKGPVLLERELYDYAREVFPALTVGLDRAFELKPVSHGAFDGFQVLTHDAPPR